MSKTGPERRAPAPARSETFALELLLEKSYDITVITGPDLVIRFASNSITDFLGWSAEELVGRNAASLIHPDNLEQMQRRHAEHMADPSLSGTRQSEARILHKDGRWIWFESRGINAMHLPPPFGGIITHLHEIARQRRAEGRLERALAAVNALVYEWDPSTDDVDRFGGGARFLGLPKADLGIRVQDWAERVHPEDRERVLATIDAARIADTRLELDYRVQRGDGQYTTVWERALTESGRGGDRRVLGLAVDITEQRRVEQELRQSEALVRTVFEAEPQCVKVLDASGRVLLMNSAGLAMLEADSPEQVIGQVASAMVAPEHREAFDALNQRVLAGDGGTGQFEIIGLQGHRRWVEVVAAPMRSDSGDITSIVAVTTDITDRRKSEDWLRLQQKVLETQAEGVVLADASGTIVYANRAFEEMFGFGSRELVGISSVRLTRSPTVVLAAARRVKAGANPIRFEFEGIHKRDGRFRGKAILNSTLIAGEPHWVVVVQDVSEQRELERALIEAASRQQERAGYDLHDGLGQDLTAISLFLRGLQDRVTVGQPGLQDDVEEIRRMVGQAIESTRALARGMSPLAVDEKGLAEAIRGLAVRSREAFDLDVRLRCDLAPDEEPELFVAMQLYRVAQEALTNIARHANASSVRLALRAVGNEISLRIQDDGTGMPEGRAAGDGMGLKIMQYRVNMLGGNLLIRRRRGGGTLVQVTCGSGREAGHSSGGNTLETPG